MAGGRFAKQRGKHLGLQRNATGGTRREVGLIKNTFHQPGAAGGTLNQRTGHPLLVHDASVADIIVQRPSLGIVKGRDNKANQTGETAQ